MTDPRRASDRYVTPAVVCVFLLVAGALIALLIAVVGYLTVRGYDPAPILDLVAKLVTAVGALGTLVLQLVGRATTAKVDKRTGQEIPERLDYLTAEIEANTDDTRQLGAALERVAEALPRPVSRHRYPADTALITNGATPAPRGG